MARARLTTALLFIGGIGTGFAASQLFVPISRQTYKNSAPSHASSSSASSIPENSTDLVEFASPLVENDRISRPAYSLQYSREKRLAIWVEEVINNPLSDSANETTAKKADRTKSHFKEDPMIPEMWRSKLIEYRNSGLDRGHLAPSADYSTDQKDMNDTFYMTNIAPQVAGFNRGYWASLERMVRSLSGHADFHVLYVYSGPLFLPKRDPETGHYRVSYQVLASTDHVPGTAVPTHFFKIILAKSKDKETNYLAAFVLPNEPIDIATPLEDFLVPLESVERASGIKFFPTRSSTTGPLVSSMPLCRKVKCIVQDFRKKVSIQGKGDGEARALNQQI